MKGRILYILFIVLSGCIAFSAYGQEGLEIGKVTIVSPTAASLGKYADIPVNKNTGIPEIGIPIFTATSGPLKLPIRLSYHASGLRVQEISSWVGSGFALQAGGAISRTVRGLPDDLSGLSVQSKAHFTDYGYSNYFYNRGDSVISDIDFAGGKLDGEPDLFFFNFNGYSGKFYFNDDRTPVLVPEQDLKIETSQTSGKIDGFTVTIPDGTKYYFGKNGNTGTVVPIEKTTVYSARFGKVSGAPISSWYLNKIESADGVFSINLSYQQEKYSYYTFSTQSMDGSKQYPYQTDQRDGYLIKNSVEGVRLSQISFPNGKVDFIPSTAVREDLLGYSPNDIIETSNTEAKALKEIQISGPTGSNSCKKFVFDQNYFVASENSFDVPPVITQTAITVNSDKKRLKLNSVQEVSCDLIEKSGSYLFSYFSEAISSTLSYGQDYWGFFNGKNSNKTIIPSYRENGNLMEGADRKPAWPQMRAGTLKTITYPTGGSTTFEFEPHDTYTNYQDYTTSWQSISLGGDGNIFQSVPDKLILITDGSGVTVDVTNQSTVNDGAVSIYDPQGQLNGFSLNCAKGESRREKASLAAGTYHVKLQFYQAGGNPAGQPLTASIGKNIIVGVNENSMVGGLRIKTITDMSSATDTSMVTSYSYLSDGVKSSGELYNRPTYVMVKRNDLQKLVKDDGPTSVKYDPPFCNTNGCIVCEIPGTSFPYVKSGGDLRTMASFQGQHMGYRQVKVSRRGQGYSLYNYYWSKFLEYPYLEGPPGAVANLLVNTLSCDLKSPNYPTVPLPFEYQRGLPQSEAHFDDKGQQVKGIQYNYAFKENKMFTPGYIVVLEERFWGSFYKLSTARKIQENIVETTYSPNGNDTIRRTNYYESPYHNLVSRSVVNASNGDSISSKQLYSFDYSVPAVDAIDNGLASYLAKDSIAKAQFDAAIISADLYRRGNRWIALQRYKRAIVDARVEYINYRRSKFSDPTNASKTAHDAAKASAGSTWKPILQLQDNYQNDPVEVSKWRNGKAMSSLFLSYAIDGTSTRVYPSSIETIDMITGANFTPSKVSGTAIVKDNRYRLENTIKYFDGNIVETKSKKDDPVSYLWGYNKQYPVAKIEGSTYANSSAVITQAQINSAADEAALRTLLAGLRTDSRTKNSLVTTYTHKTLEGVTSKTDSRGVTEFYEYDKLFRLKNVKDYNQFITQSYNYNYVVKPSTNQYFNAVRSKTFTVACGNPGLVGDQVIYTVAAGVYTSNVSQVDADSKAQADIDANGQNYANANGGCKAIITSTNIGMDGDVMGVLTFTGSDNVIYKLGQTGGNTIKLPVGSYTVKFGTPGTKALFDINGQNLKLVDLLPGGEVILGTYYIGAAFTVKASRTYYSNGAMSQNFTKNNCTAGMQGSTVVYTVAAGTYYSFISQADVNQKASDDIATKGQNYANASGTCKSLVALTLQRNSTVNNFNPVTVEFIPYGLSYGTNYTFPSLNGGTANYSIAGGTYSLRFTTPTAVPFSIPIYLNGSQIGAIPSGLTSYTVSATFTEGVSHVLRINISNL
ncbi:DUF5977 domain-containing protein [Sphingobacterium siyangense]|uniref:DUF5977 domain-containing protein n=1 Tax=Sphingobacterium siyangense TaxID=459529 RepID=UPI003DA53546